MKFFLCMTLAIFLLRLRTTWTSSGDVLLIQCHYALNQIDRHFCLQRSHTFLLEFIASRKIGHYDSNTSVNAVELRCTGRSSPFLYLPFQVVAISSQTLIFSERTSKFQSMGPSSPYLCFSHALVFWKCPHSNYKPPLATLSTRKRIEPKYSQTLCGHSKDSDARSVARNALLYPTWPPSSPPGSPTPKTPPRSSSSSPRYQSPSA